MKKLDLSLIFQLSVTTSHMDGMLSNWRSHFAVDEDTIIRKSTKEIFDRGEYHCKNFLEREVEFYHQYYRFDLGGLDMEIIQPITTDNVNPYTSFLSHGKNGLQHLGVKITNREDLVEEMKRLGVPVYTYAYMGPEEEDISKRADCYFYDLRPQLGIIIEAGGAVVGPLASDPRAGNNASLGMLNSFAARPELPAVRTPEGLEKMRLGRFYQIAAVVSDADAALQNWEDFFGVDKAAAGGEEGICRFYTFEAGGIGIKLIEPTGDGIYKRFHEQSGGNNILYAGAAMEDRGALLRNMEKLRVAPLAHLTGETGDPTDRDAYVYDLRDKFGMILKVSP